MRIPFISLVAAGSLALGGCAYGGLNFGVGSDYGYGYGSPYSGYGYQDPYYGGYGYGDYGYGYSGYGSPYSGWYGGYYYPGTGYYVYDSYRRPHRWSDRQQRYWSQRREQVRTSSTSSTTNRTADWSGFDRTRARSTATREQRRADRDYRPLRDREKVPD